MDGGPRLVEPVGDVVVELAVLALGDLALGPHPEGGGLVELLLLAAGPKRIGRAIWSEYLGDHDLEPPLLEELLGILPQMQHDVGAALDLGRRRQP